MGRDQLPGGGVVWGVINCQVGVGIWHARCAVLRLVLCCGESPTPQVVAGAVLGEVADSAQRPARKMPPPCTPSALQCPALPRPAPPCPAPMPQRKCDAYLAAQRGRRWDKGIENFRNTDNSELRVGVMGLGEGWLDCCLHGWCLRGELTGVASWAGHHGLARQLFPGGGGC